MKNLLSRSITWVFFIPIILLISWITIMVVWANIKITSIIGSIAFWSLFFASKYISNYIKKTEDQSNRIIPLDEYDEKPNLTSINGFGTRLLKAPGNPYIKYQFFCMAFLPVMPLDCYAATSEGYNSYRWFGTAEWNTLEIIAIYLQWWGGIIGTLYTLFSIVILLTN